VNAGTFETPTRAAMTDTMARVRATQFLQRATFGPTNKSVTELSDRMKQVGVNAACEEWIDAQFAMDYTSHTDLAIAMLTEDGWAPDEGSVGISRYRDHAWSHAAIAAPDQLKQRIGWALSQILVVNSTPAGFNNNPNDTRGDPQWLGLARYYDMLLENSDDSYREVLNDVTFSPIMGLFLSSFRNGKGNGTTVFPDENYAREIMQLFTIGLYKLRLTGELKKDAAGDPIPTYDNETIKELAQVFTGLTYNGNTNFNNNNRSLSLPMTMYNPQHDQSDKYLLDGELLDWADKTDGEGEIRAAIDHLYMSPNIGPFISRLLIQRLVRSNPSKGYIRRVAKVFNGTSLQDRGDMKAVVKAILLDREAWNSIRLIRRRATDTLPMRVHVRSTGSERNKMVEPVVMFAGFIRRFASPDEGPVTTADYRLPQRSYDWIQAAYRAPSVFNFYLPNFQPAGPVTNETPSRRIPNGILVAPEFELLTSVVANRWANRYRTEIRRGSVVLNQINNAKAGKVVTTIPLDFSLEDGLADDPAALAEHLDMILCSGTMTNSFRNAIVAALEEEVPLTGTDEQIAVKKLDRAKGAILSVLTSPASMIVE
jgi:uncharacterized protein (DUF1800 family)